MPEDKKEILNNKPEFNQVSSAEETKEENPDNIGRFEQIKTPEVATEKADKKLEDVIDMSEGELGGIISVGQQRKISAQRAKDIEKILEKDLDEIYLAMPVEKRIVFKAVGEKTIAQINELIEMGKINMKKVIDLIRAWLLIIPGVNKFFLEQETKIKADEIIKLGKTEDKPD